MTFRSYVEHAKYTKVDGKYIKWAAWVLEYEQYKYPEDLDMVSKLIVDNLQEKFCPPKYRDKNRGNIIFGEAGNNLFGHCYHATQSLYYFFKDANLKIMSAKCEGPAEQHWWLQDGDKIIDITAGQYDTLNFEPPYDKGKETKWYGWRHRPHRKTQDLMKLVQPTAKLEWKQFSKKPQKSY